MRESLERKEWFTTSDLGRILGYSRKSINNWLESKDTDKLPVHHRVGERGDARFHRTDVENWVREHRMETLQQLIRRVTVGF